MHKAVFMIIKNFLGIPDKKKNLLNATFFYYEVTFQH